VGLIISFSSHNTISGNNISANQDGINLGVLTSENMLNQNTIRDNHGIGINLQDTNNNLIVDNIISKNTIGINISGDTNTIKHNLISNNSLGITIYHFGWNTFVSSNDFLNNTRNAGFKELFRDRHNVWTKNYWDRSRVLPQPIFGRMSWRSFSISIPWMTFDWHPAKQPNHTSCFA
jgi:parallel beta-helix repeat protein